MKLQLWVVAAVGLVTACQGDRAWHDQETPELAFEHWLSEWQEAPGLEARISLRGFLPTSKAAEFPSSNPADPPALMQEAMMNFSMAKPAYGQIQFTVRARLLVGGDSNWQSSQAGIVGDGNTLWAWDGDQKTVWALGDSFDQTATHMPDLAPLKAWAQLPLTPFNEVTWLQQLDGGPPSGFRVIRPNYVHEYQLDPSGKLLSAKMIPTAGPEAMLPRFEFEIHYLELLTTVQAEQYAAEPPPAYTKITK